MVTTTTAVEANVGDTGTSATGDGWSKSESWFRVTRSAHQLFPYHSDERLDFLPHVGRFEKEEILRSVKVQHDCVSFSGEVNASNNCRKKPNIIDRHDTTCPEWHRSSIDVTSMGRITKMAKNRDFDVAATAIEFWSRVCGSILECSLPFS